MRTLLLSTALAASLAMGAAHAENEQYVGKWIDVAHHTNTIDEGRLAYAKDACGRSNGVTRAYFACMRKQGYAWRQDTPADIKAAQDAETARRWRILGDTFIDVVANQPLQQPQVQCDTRAYFGGRYTTTCR